MIARFAAVAALAGAVVLVVLVLFGNSSNYTLHLEFQDAGGLVTGDQVMIGPASVGSIKSIGLAPNGAAQVTLGLKSDASPLHEGTVARIYDRHTYEADKRAALEALARLIADVLDPQPANVVPIRQAAE